MRFACMAGFCLAFAAFCAGAAPLDFSDSPCTAPEARQFDFWIGEWDVLNRHLMPDGVWRVSGRATNKVYSVLNGCGIIEHWEGALGGRPLYGFSIRAWDPGAKKWNLILNWPSPERPHFGSLEGVFTHGRGEFFFERLDENQNKVRERYSFSDATDRSLRWDAARSADDGVTWSTHWIMEFTRRDPATDLPLFNGPEHSRSRCRGDEFRGFDFSLGTWTRSEASGAAEPDGAGARYRVRAIPVLEGCAVMEFAERLGEGPVFESFSVRSFLPALDKWVQYSIDTDGRVFERWEGELDEGKIVLERKEKEAEEEEGSRRRRQVWSRIEDGSYQVEMEVSSDGGRSWSSESASRLTKEDI